jgi:hypothetical protein
MNEKSLENKGDTTFTRTKERKSTKNYERRTGQRKSTGKQRGNYLVMRSL